MPVANARVCQTALAPRDREDRATLVSKVAAAYARFEAQAQASVVWRFQARRQGQPAPAAAPDQARMSKGQALAQQHKCVFCHGAALDGGQGVPRIGGQKDDYVRAALHGYKTGERPGYTRAMSEALSQVPVEDLDLLAYYVVNFTGK